MQLQMSIEWSFKTMFLCTALKFFPEGGGFHSSGAFNDTTSGWIEGSRSYRFDFRGDVVIL